MPIFPLPFFMGGLQIAIPFSIEPALSTKFDVSFFIVFGLGGNVRDGEGSD